MSEEWKSCPRCGSYNVGIWHDKYSPDGNWVAFGDTNKIRCEDCKTYLRIEKWQSDRPLEDALKAELEQLKEENRRLRKERLIKDNLLLRLKEASPGGTYFQKWGKEIEAVLLVTGEEV